MSTSSLQIQIQAFVQGLADVQKLGQEIGKTAAQTGQSTQTNQQAAQSLADFTDKNKEAASALKVGQETIAKAAESFNALSGYVKTAVAAFIAFAGVASLKETADIAARNETLATVLGVVAKNAGYSEEKISSYEKEVKALGITTSAARDSLTKLIQSGIELGPVAGNSASQVGRLARASQDLAVVSGKNSSETFRGLITNIQQLDAEGLRYQGIIVNLEDAYDKFGLAIGKAGKALSNQEKQQAAANEVLVQATKLQGAYETSLDTVGKKLASLARYQEEAGNQIGQIFLPAYGALVDAATAFLKRVEEIAASINKTTSFAETLKTTFNSAISFASSIISKLVDGAENLGYAFSNTFAKFGNAFKGIDTGGFLTAIKSILDVVIQFGLTLVTALGNSAPLYRVLVNTFLSLYKVVKDIIVSVFGLGESLFTLDSITRVLQVGLTTVAYVIAAIADAAKLIQAAVLGVYAGVMLLGGAVALLLSKLTEKYLPEVSAAYKKASEDSFKSGEEAGKAAEKIITGFAEGKSEVQKLNKALEELKASTIEQGEAAKLSAAKQSEGAKQAELIVLAYTRAVESGALSGSKAAVVALALKERIKELGGEYGLTATAVDGFNTRLGSTGKTDEILATAFKGLGKSAKELQGDITDAGIAAAGFFRDISANSNLTKTAVFEAFSTSVAKAGAIKDLIAFRTELDTSFKDGKINAQQFSSANELLKQKFEELYAAAEKSATSVEALERLKGQAVEVSIAIPELLDVVSTKIVESSFRLRNVFKDGLEKAKFLEDITSIGVELQTLFKKGEISSEELKDRLLLVKDAFAKAFDTQLKAAKTIEDFKRIGEAAQDAANRGIISQTKLGEINERIEEKRTKAREKAVLQAQQQAEAEAKIASVAAATTELVKAGVDVQKAKNDLVKAEKEYREQGTPIAKLQLELARNQLQIAEQQFAINRAKLAEEVAGYDLLIAKQKEKIAADKVVAEPGNEVAAAALLVAEKQSQQKEILNNLAKQNLSVEQQRLELLKQQRLVLEQQIQQQQVEISEREQADKEVAARRQSTSNAISSIANSMEAALAKEAGGNEVLLKQMQRRKDAALQIFQGEMTVLQAVQRWYAAQEEALNIARAYHKLLGQIKDNTQAVAAVTQKLNEAWGSIDENIKFAAYGLDVYTKGVRGLGGAFESTDASMRAALAEQNRALTEYEKTLRKIKIGAYEAALAFGNTARSIREELLQLQGKDDEIAQARYEQRKKELDLEYALAAAKVKFAIAQTGEEDGGPLSKALLALNEQYAQSKENLGEIFKIEKANRDKIKAENATKNVEQDTGLKEKLAHEQGQKAQNAKLEAEVQYGYLTEKNSAERIKNEQKITQEIDARSKLENTQRELQRVKTQDRLARIESSNVIRPDFSRNVEETAQTFNPSVSRGNLQSIAGKAGEPEKEKEPQIIVKFDDGNIKVNATIAERSSDDFLKLVTTARRLA